MTAPLPAPPDLIDGKYEVYRVVTDYEGLHDGLVDRVDDLQVTRMGIDEAAGFAPGYAAKVLCTPPMKTLGRDSVGRDGLGKMLKATGMALILVIDDERFAAIKEQLTLRKRPPRRDAKQLSTAVLQELKMGIFRANGALGGRRRLVKLSKRQRTLIAKSGARARWSKKRTRNIADSPAG